MTIKSRLDRPTSQPTAADDDDLGDHEQRMFALTDAIVKGSAKLNSNLSSSGMPMLLRTGPVQPITFCVRSQRQTPISTMAGSTPPSIADADNEPSANSPRSSTR
jgi:hypothetical protein